MDNNKKEKFLSLYEQRDKEYFDVIQNLIESKEISVEILLKNYPTFVR